MANPNSGFDRAIAPILQQLGTATILLAAPTAITVALGAAFANGKAFVCYAPAAAGVGDVAELSAHINAAGLLTITATGAGVTADRQVNYLAFSAAVAYPVNL